MQPIDPSISYDPIPQLWEYMEDPLAFKIEERLNNDMFSIDKGNEMVIQMEDSLKSNNLVKIRTDGVRMFVKTATIQRSYALDARRWNVVFEKDAEDIEEYLNTKGIKLIHPCDYTFELNKKIFKSEFRNNKEKGYILTIKTGGDEPLGYKFKYRIPVKKR